MPDIRWPSLSADSNFSTLFCDLAFQHNFSQSIELPTHSHGNTLDLIITNCEDQITIDSTNSCFLKSNHYSIPLTSIKLALTNLQERNHFTSVTTPEVTTKA